MRVHEIWFWYLSGQIKQQKIGKYMKRKRMWKEQKEQQNPRSKSSATKKNQLHTHSERIMFCTLKSLMTILDCSTFKFLLLFLTLYRLLTFLPLSVLFIDFYFTLQLNRHTKQPSWFVPIYKLCYWREKMTIIFLKTSNFNCCEYYSV